MYIYSFTEISRLSLEYDVLLVGVAAASDVCLSSALSTVENK